MTSNGRVAGDSFLEKISEQMEEIEKRKLDLFGEKRVNKIDFLFENMIEGLLDAYESALFDKSSHDYLYFKGMLMSSIDDLRTYANRSLDRSEDDRRYLSKYL